jgi:dolichol-phosphate mannosyltransferase
MIKISVIIPFLNEAENIPELVQSLNNYFNGKKEFTAEVIFVNDGSSDQSVSILCEQTIQSYVAKVLSFSKNYGSHAALRAGIQHASGDYITFMYADLQDPLTLIEQMVAEINSAKNCDIVWASRRSTENGWFESAFSQAYSALMKKYVSALYPAKGFDVVMFSKKVANVLNEQIEANSSIFLQILTLGFIQKTLHYDKQPRKKGKSKWTLSKKVKLLIDSFISFSYAPIRFVTLVGVILFFIGAVFSLYLIIRKLTSNDLVSGWTMLITILMLGFGITNISLGIIAEYLWRTLDSSRKRPVFIIDNIIELKHE